MYILLATGRGAGLHAEKQRKIVAYATRKPCYSKGDRAMRPVYGCPEQFWEPLTTPTATFPETVNGLFVAIGRMKVRTKFEVGSFTRS